MLRMALDDLAGMWHLAIRRTGNGTRRVGGLGNTSWTGGADFLIFISRRFFHFHARVTTNMTWSQSEIALSGSHVMDTNIISGIAIILGTIGFAGQAALLWFAWRGL
jgi:hypothetical protein